MYEFVTCRMLVAKYEELTYCFYVFLTIAYIY